VWSLLQLLLLLSARSKETQQDKTHKKLSNSMKKKSSTTAVYSIGRVALLSSVVLFEKNILIKHMQLK
jgi:hypothetical protein